MEFFDDGVTDERVFDFSQCADVLNDVGDVGLRDVPIGEKPDSGNSQFAEIALVSRRQLRVISFKYRRRGVCGKKKKKT